MSARGISAAKGREQRVDGRAGRQMGRRLGAALAAALLVGQRLGRGALFGAALIMAGQVLVVANAYLKAEE